MSFAVRAITLDLDDTIWPLATVMVRAEPVLDAWLREHAPRTAARWTLEARLARRGGVAPREGSGGQMGDGRECLGVVVTGKPSLANYCTRQLMWTLEQMLGESGDEFALVQPAVDAFCAARCEVEHYEDSLDALQRLSARVPLAALSNGNADLQRIGLMHVFRFQLGAREHGAAKPHASIFHAACERLECAPDEVLHVGDDVEMDVLGAHRAGLRSCWINRVDCDGVYREWPHADIRPDLEFSSLAALADWLDARIPEQSAA